MADVRGVAHVGFTTYMRGVRASRVLLRLQSQNRQKRMTRNVIPPITPPAMAPIWDRFRPVRALIALDKITDWEGMTGEGRVALGGGRVVVARGDEEQDFEDVGTRDDDEGGIEEDKVLRQQLAYPEHGT